jgi:hypothetical protein
MDSTKIFSIILVSLMFVNFGTSKHIMNGVDSSSLNLKTVLFYEYQIFLLDLTEEIKS